MKNYASRDNCDSRAWGISTQGSGEPLGSLKYLLSSCEIVEKTMIVVTD